MTQKQVNIFSVVFLAIIASLIFTIQIKKSSIQNDFQSLKMENISSVSFYKDFLRQSEGLYIALNDNDDLLDLLHCITDMKRSNKAIKTYTIAEEVWIHLTIQTDESQPLELHVMRMKELGDQALVKINVIKKNGYTDGGVYSSDQFLPWLRSISSRAEYERVWERNP